MCVFFNKGVSKGFWDRGAEKYDPSKKNEAVAKVAIKILLALGGVFIILATAKILPAKANSLSEIGAWGYAIGGMVAVLGFFASLLDIKANCNKKPSKALIEDFYRAGIIDSVRFSPVKNEKILRQTNGKKANEEFECNFSRIKALFTGLYQNNQKIRIENLNEDQLSDLHARYYGDLQKQCLRAIGSFSPAIKEDFFAGQGAYIYLKIFVSYEENQEKIESLSIDFPREEAIGFKKEVTDFKEFNDRLSEVKEGAQKGLQMFFNENPEMPSAVRIVCEVASPFKNLSLQASHKICWTGVYTEEGFMLSPLIDLLEF